MTHPQPRSQILREAGLACAVLAIWLLSLLSPMHQVSGVVRDLAARGYDVGASWTICAPATIDHGDPGAQLPVCPAHGLGQHDLVLPVGAPILLLARVALAQGAGAAAPDALVLQPRDGPAQPRGPPAI